MYRRMVGSSVLPASDLESAAARQRLHGVVVCVRAAVVHTVFMARTGGEVALLKYV